MKQKGYTPSPSVLRTSGSKDWSKGFATTSLHSRGFAPILIVLLIALGIGGYFIYTNYSNSQYKTNQNLSVTNWTPKPTPILSSNSSASPTPKPQNSIQFGIVKVGDVISGLTIKSIKPFNQELEMSSKNFIVEFSGKIKLSGKYTIDDSKSFYTKNAVLFKPDSASSAKLPYIFSPNLELKNPEKAIELLSFYGKSGNVTIEIDNYSSFLLDQSEFGGGAADLVRIVK